MAKIILLKNKKEFHPVKPSGPRGPFTGAAAIKQMITTQAIGRAA